MYNIYGNLYVFTRSRYHNRAFGFTKQVIIMSSATSPGTNANEGASSSNSNNIVNVERETFLEGVGKYENLRITKNVVLLGIAFMLHFTAFHGTANLQSSVNTDGDVGTYTLAAMYGSLILSNIFLPVAVIR